MPEQYVMLLCSLLVRYVLLFAERTTATVTSDRGPGAEQKLWEGELEHRTRDGREVIVDHHQLVRAAEERMERVLGANRDITKHKLAEEALRESHERFQVTLKSIGDALIATDASGNVSFLNPVAAALTGWQPEDAFGRRSGAFSGSLTRSPRTCRGHRRLRAERRAHCTPCRSYGP